MPIQYGPMLVGAVTFLVSVRGIGFAQSVDPKRAVVVESKPWRLERAVGSPSWLTFGLEHRSRFEHLSHDYRGKATGDAAGLSLRTLAMAEARLGTFLSGIELEDSRIYASDDTTLNTTLADPLEILQAYAGIRTKDLFASDDSVEVRAGRITIDLGTRRIVARNGFRNTINGFTGIDAKWASATKHVARASVAVPVNRLPADAEALEDNRVELDEENTDALLWTAYYGSPRMPLNTNLDVYFVGFHERDGAIATRNRQLLTVGLRWFRKPANGNVDFDLELIPQVGRSRATTAMDDLTDLEHRAWTSHIELGLNPSVAWKPRFALLHDYASGDKQRDDGSTERFDPLFGARRFDFGPTGLYGPFNRSNIQSPGLRLSAAPSAKFDLFVGYRLFWLASRTDTWVAANVRDPLGNSGSFVGEHAEMQLRWSPLPKTLSVEGGAAYLRRGDFAKSAPDTRRANPAYFYTQLTVNL